MIQLTNVILRRGAKTLFEGLDLTVHAGRRAGVVGRNGIGKTSLFSLLRGRLLAEEGDVRVPRNWTIAHLAQETEPSSSTALGLDAGRRPAAPRGRASYRDGHGERRRCAACGALRGARGHRWIHRGSAGGADPARTRVRPGRPLPSGGGLLGRLADPAQPRPDPDVPLRSAASRRADQPPRSRCGDVARAVACGPRRHDPPHLPRPRLPRPNRDRHRAP